MYELNKYNFSLPEDLIAKEPLKKRSSSRLMVVRKKDSTPLHDHFKNIDNYLSPGDVLVINNTKVMKARFYVFKPSGKKIEALLVRKLDENHYSILIKNLGSLRNNRKLRLAHINNGIIEVIEKIDDEPGAFKIFCTIDLAQYIDEHGTLPLPPYLKRNVHSNDYENYQTIFSSDQTLGAIAAPTAGLHFDDEIKHRLINKGIKIAEITLHVGPGTFLPIRDEDIRNHRMHAEYFHMNENCATILNEAKDKGKKVIVVGSTSMRVIEQVMQLAHKRGNNKFFPCHDRTSLFITPGYKFLGCDAMITNFHLPKSTLFILVASVCGLSKILSAYKEAIDKNYRFFSYGDACFLEIHKDYND